MHIHWNLSPVIRPSVFSVMSPLLYKQTDVGRHESKQDNKDTPIDLICSVEKIVVDEALIDTVLGPPKHQGQCPDTHLQGPGAACTLVLVQVNFRCCCWTGMDTVWWRCAVH